MLTADQLADRASRAGSHYFDRATMRFFSSRVHDVWELAPDRVLFTTSEQDEGAPRLYSVRLAIFAPNGERVDISTAPGETFQEHRTLSAARKAARAWILADGAARLPVVAPSLLTSSERNAWYDALAGHTLWPRYRGRLATDGERQHSPAILKRLTEWGALRELPAGNGVLTSYVRA